ncbi:unnamed protein product [Periconia digitata]|uniref:Uncharacterized protein n=1 Tax=Periconia digitata TaxID=1303443 RepID=A0A9W4UXC8_9PLEO|nr:unnamed protein product [Periconia digitata]
MAYSRLFTPRGFAFLSAFSFAGGYMALKSRAMSQRQRDVGDYSVTVDRSGMSLRLPHLPPVSWSVCPYASYVPTYVCLDKMHSTID